MLDDETQYKIALGLREWWVGFRSEGFDAHTEVFDEILALLDPFYSDQVTQTDPEWTLGIKRKEAPGE